MSEKRICKYCGMELPEDIPHGLRECHLYAVARIVELERQTRPIEDALNKRIAELEAEIDQLTAHSDIERQDDKSSKDTQTETFVYGKESER